MTNPRPQLDQRGPGRFADPRDADYTTRDQIRPEDFNQESVAYRPAVVWENDWRVAHAVRASAPPPRETAAHDAGDLRL